MESFEKSLEKLEQTVKQLEAGELDLEQSVKAFELGMEQVKACQKVLEHAQKRVDVLLSQSEGKDVVEALDVE